MSELFNISDRLTQSAQTVPDHVAIAVPGSRDASGNRQYDQRTFAEFEADVSRLASQLQHLGIQKGDRMVLMVPPGIEFIELTFALFRAGAIVVLIDPGMGRKNIFSCLKQIEPQGIIGVEMVHWIRMLFGLTSKQHRCHICVNSSLTSNFLPGTVSWKKFTNGPIDLTPPVTTMTDPAAIIFTSGSTGPPKGVLYEHQMFNAQVDLLQQAFQIEPGGADLPGFPLFALFNLALGLTTVVPDMNPTRPAEVKPENIFEAFNDWSVTQAFGSPAFWNQVGRSLSQNKQTFPQIDRLFSAGAPVPVDVIERIVPALTKPGADIFTPYGATEALPVCLISGREVLEQTAELTRQGAGTCVGRPFPGVDVRVIKRTDGPIEDWSAVQLLPAGEIGEIIASSPSVTKEYYRHPEASRAAKIWQGESHWHRMGDLGYFDELGRLWFCGRKAHLVQTAEGVMYPVRCEAIFNTHPNIYRSALVGKGPVGQQTPVLIVEPEADHWPTTPQQKQTLTEQLLSIGQQNELTQSIQNIVFHKALPVDRRHNVKIHREDLKTWIDQQK